MEYKVRPMNLDSLNWLHHIYATDLSSKAKLTAAVVVSFMYQDNEEAFPGLGRLSHETSLGKRTVQRAIDELIDAGWLAKKSGGRVENGSLSQNRYRRKWLSGLPKPNGYESNVAPISTSATVTPPMVTETIGVATVTPPIVTETIGVATETIGIVSETIGVVSQWPTKEKEKKKVKEREKKPTTKVNPLEFVINDQVDANAWREWWEYKGKKTVGKATVSKTANQMARFTPAQQQNMVDYSIRGEYPALYDEQAKEVNQDGNRSKQGGQQPDPLNEWAQW